MSFIFDASTDISGSGSFQGNLSSSYTNALTAYLKGDGADLVAYLSKVINGLSIEDALILKTAVANGEFTLSGLFSAAQSKAGAVDGELITNPTPTLTIGDITIDLTAILTDADTASWDTFTKKDTITHTREFYTASSEPTGYSSDWADPQTPENRAPTADDIVLALTEYDEKAAAKSGTDLTDVNLLTAANAADADGDDLSVVANSVTLANGDPLPDYITYADGVLSIDKNHESLDNLYLGSEWTVAITYKITDGEATIDNTVNLTITGTADQFTGSTDKYAEHVTADFNTSTWDGSFNFTLTAPVGAFDFAGTALVTVTGDIDSSIHNEFVVVTLEGGDAVTLGLISATGKNQDETYSTDTATANFASADSTVTVTYDSNTAGGVNGVDGLSLVGVDVTADYTYWM